MLLENSNCSTHAMDLVAVFILEFRRVSLPDVNILLLLLLRIDLLLMPVKSDCVTLTYKFSPTMIKVTEFLKRLSLNRRPLVASRRYSGFLNPYPTAFPYGNGMVLHFYQQLESSTTKSVHKVINKGLKAYV